MTSAPRPGTDGADEGDGAPSGAELISAVSHELRQPLASIRGFAEMLLRHWPDFTEADRVRMLEQVVHDATRAGRIMDDLVEVSRLEAGRLPLHVGPVDLARVVERAVLNVRVSYPDLCPAVVVESGMCPLVADAFKLEQVLTNILDNACKYASPGTVRVTARSTTRDSRAMAELAVSDGGAGIPAEDLPRVTEKFFRGPGQATPGMGLGLWISKSIVEAHGGALEALSDGQGTTVRFTIPLHDGQPAGKLAGP